MSSPGNYTAREQEEFWYNQWIDNRLFASQPNDKKPFTVVIPPPNVTGILHMGHTLNNTIQDILVRKARLQGLNACWVPGTDHASIATEAKVVNLLKEKGINKFEIGREKFLEHAFEWKEKYGGIILSQFKKLGLSLDWDRTAFTMDPERYDSVIEVFNRLYEKGLIYRGARIIHWDPKAKTALSDEEVNYLESTDFLYHIRYAIDGTDDEWLTIATTRPETIMADTAICVHPEDERYYHLHGKMAVIPLIGRKIPIIVDEYVDREFGTGCLKVTPAHDINDYNLGIKHQLDVIDILNDDATLNEKAIIYVGKSREEAREGISLELESKGFLLKKETLIHNVGTSERTGAVIEPKLSTQWFCDMQSLAPQALEVVMNDEIQFHPAKFKNTYRHWMENIKDWCISRQLWWGHRIPVWYLTNGQFVVAKNEDEAFEKALKILPTISREELKQDEDVLDTWFSAWLWPLSVFSGITKPDNKDINYYYPTDLLVTGPDIIFFWVARMIMAGIEFRNQIPFKHVYFTGMVRDKQGRKMSKQLGNSPDLLQLIDQYGADGVRFGILISSPAGNDLLFDEKLCEQGSAFINKIWNAYKLIDSWKGFDKIVEETSVEIQAKNDLAVALFEQKFQATLVELEKSYENFRISEALQTVYKLIWDDFCSSYLEWVKPKKDTEIDRKTFELTLDIFDRCLIHLHPFMPFITEEIYHRIKVRSTNESICTATYPKPTNEGSSQGFEQLRDLISTLRAHKISHNISFAEPTHFLTDSESIIGLNPVVKSLIGSTIATTSSQAADEAGYKSFLFGAIKIWNADLSNSISEEEKSEILKEIDRLKSFMAGIDKKLSNERFVASAPAEVVEKERVKMNDANAKIQSLVQKLN